MVGPTDGVQPWMPRAERDSDAWLCHVSVAGGARRRGCAAAGVPECFSGPLGAGGQARLEPFAQRVDVDADRAEGSRRAARWIARRADQQVLDLDPAVAPL